MPLNAVVDSIEAVPEVARDLYVQKDGKYHLAIDGLVPASKLSEFRDNNISLANQVKELTERYDGIDPEAWKDMQVQARRIRDKELVEAGKFEELYSERIGPMKTAHDRELAAERTEKTKLQSTLEGLLIDGAIRDAAAKSGVRSTAIDDVLLRGRSAFKVVDGKAVPMDGDKQIFGKDAEVMSVNEWIEGLTERAPHLFEPSQGSGSKGNGGGGGGAKTMTRATFNALDPMAQREAAKTMKIVD